MGSFGNNSLAIFIGLFGGSTLLLFLICFCCQRKLQARTLAMAHITDLESQRHSNQNRNHQRRSDAHQLLPSLVTPPPDYVTAVVKDPTLPTYEAAMAEVHNNAHHM